MAPVETRWPGPELRRTAALLKLGYRCNNGCRFCHSAPHRGVDLDTAAARARIREAAAAGVGRIVLSGGEPTLRKDLVSLIAEVRGLGCEPGIVTNGRMLAYRGLAEALLGAGLRQVYLSLHSHRAEVHDALVRAPGAHAQALRALGALAARAEVTLRVNAVLTRHNLGDLEGLGQLVARAAARRARSGGAPILLTFSFVEPEGNALEDFEGLVPSLAEAAARVDAAVARLEPRLGGQGVTLAADGFPPCVLDPTRVRRSDLWTEGFVFVTEAFEPHLHTVDEAHKRRGGRCYRCSVDGCAGAYATYLDRRGDEELQPVRARRGPSVDYVALGPVPALPLHLSEPAACPSLAGTLPHPDPRREALVVGSEAVTLHRAEAEDFPEQALHQIRVVQRQLYRPVDRREAAVDFATSLRKLCLQAVCTGCPHRLACGGRWEDAEQDALAADEAAVRAHLGGCSGAVLDVGCGAAAYLDAFAPAVRAGRVTLQLLDPDPAVAERLAAASVPHGFTCASVESLAAQVAGSDRACPELADALARGFDEVLAIRSWNHFADVDLAAAALAGALRPGGRLTVVGDVALGLARSRAAVAEVRRRGRVPEHWRNHDLGQAREALLRVGLEVVMERPVSPERSNLWWLVLRRPPSR